MPNIRDTNRNRLYAAEQDVRRWLRSAPVAAGSTVVKEHEYRNLGAAKKHLTAIWQRAFDKRITRAKTVPELRFVDRLDHKAIGRHQWSMGATGTGIHSEILLAPDGRIGSVLLHEVAHAIQCRAETYLPSHGGEFARTFLALMRLEYGETVALKLERAFDDHHVHHRVEQQVANVRKRIRQARNDYARWCSPEPRPERVPKLPFRTLAYGGGDLHPHVLEGGYIVGPNIDPAAPYLSATGIGESEPVQVPTTWLRHVEFPMFRER